MRDLLWRFYRADYYADCAALIIQIHHDYVLCGALCRTLYCVRDLSWKFYCVDYHADCVASIVYSFVWILLYKSIVLLYKFHCANSIV